jgi:hypothetical protein
MFIWNIKKCAKYLTNKRTNIVWDHIISKYKWEEDKNTDKPVFKRHLKEHGNFPFMTSCSLYTG